MIVGDLPQFAAVSIGWHDDVEDAREEIRKAIGRVEGPDGVLILTDMFGGTPSNLGLTFLETDRVEVITGVNLPMLIKLSRLQSGSNLTAAAREMREHGRNAIWVASDLLKGEGKA
jgi:PTS system mannose-specific IIA component